MPFRKQKFVFCYLLLLAGSVGHAGTAERWLEDYRQASATGKSVHALDVDNDSLLLKRDDGFYTSGIRYTRRYHMAETDGTAAFGWRIGQELYTASDINLPPQQVGPPDRPYAGWLYGGFFRETFRTDGTSVRMGIDIGCLGPCAGGEWTQKNLHRILNQALPQGWGRQVGNEWGVVLHAESVPLRYQLNRYIDVAPRLQGRFGNIHTDLAAEVTARAGRLRMLPWQPGWHAYLRTGMRAVAYNATLQGGYFSSGDAHVVEPRRWVGSAEIGMAWQAGAYGAAISLIRNGNELRGVSDSFGTQNFLRLQFVYVP